MRFFNSALNTAVRLIVALTFTLTICVTALSAEDKKVDSALENETSSKEEVTDYHHVSYIDLKNQTLNLAQLQDLWQKVEKNNSVWHISWGDIEPEGAELKEKIENRIIENNKNYRRYPRDFTYGLLSEHVYQLFSQGAKAAFLPEANSYRYNQYLEDWEVYKVYDYPEYGGYYGVLYLNRKLNQLVLAHRGTTVKWKNLLGTDSPLKTDIAGILAGDIVSQQVAAYTTTQEAIKVAKGLRSTLSFTGHSLGAWLAELSLYFSHRDFNYPNVRAVTFDSPGSVIHMENLRSNVINNTTEFDLKKLDIITYLSAPNFVNSCNKHLGKVYRLFPEVIEPEGVKHVMSWFERLKAKIGVGEGSRNTSAAVNSIFGHSITGLVATFDPATGRPYKYEEVLDWPVIKYIPTKQRGETIISAFLEDAFRLVVKKEVVNLRDSIRDNTVMTLLALFNEIKNGNIDQAQYLNYFQYLENSNSAERAKGGYMIKKKLSTNEEFSLNYEGHYRTREVNLYEDVLCENNKGSADWYLKELRKKSIDHLSDSLVKKQLGELKQMYNIIPQEKHLITSPSVEIDNVREYALHLLQVIPEVKEFLENPISLLPSNVAQNGEVLASYLPQERATDYIEPSQIISIIDNLLKKEQHLILTGIPGVGKTSAALEYAYRQKSKISGTKVIPRWFMADSADKLYLTYRNLAAELEIKIDGSIKDRQVLINMVNHKLAQYPLDTILFIFEDVRNYEHIKSYILNLPTQVKVLITTRNAKLESSVRRVKVPPFSEEEAGRYIDAYFQNAIANKHKEALIKIFASQHKEILPYKLSKAVSYIRNTEYGNIEQVISKIAKNHADQAETSLILGLLKSFPLALQILQYAAYLDGSFISLEIFKELFMVDDKALKKPIDKLVSLSLVELAGMGKYGFNISTLVQEEVLKCATRYSKEKYIIKEETIKPKLLKALNSLFPEVTDIPGNNWKIAELYYPHSLKLIKMEAGKYSLSQASLFSKLSSYNEYVLNQFGQALEYEQQSLKIKQKLHPQQHPSIAQSLHTIGRIYHKLGNSQEAFTYFQKALEIRQKLYKGNHPDIAESVQWMGIVYRYLGNPQRGLIFQKQALKMRKELYGQNHSDIAESLNAMGWVCYDLGRLEEALDYLEQALAMEYILYKGNHPDVVITLSHIGDVYKALGKPQKALNYNLKALTMRKELYPGNHRYALLLLNNLGETYQALGNFAEAMKLYEEALKIGEELFQGRHSGVATALYNIGTLYYDINHISKSLKSHEKALKLRKELYQGDHPKIAKSLVALARTYEKLGDKEQSISLYKQALEMSIRTFGDDHPYSQKLQEVVLELEQ